MLSARCLRYQGGNLVVLPTYGWGWNGATGPVDYALIEAAGPFDIRADRFFWFRDELRGLVGLVTMREHMFAGLQFVAAEMIVGDHDFTEQLCHRYDIAFGTEPASDDEWPTFSAGALRYEGHGIIAVDRACIERWLGAQRAMVRGR